MPRYMQGHRKEIKVLAPAGGGNPALDRKPEPHIVDPFRRTYRPLSKDESEQLYSMKTRAGELYRHFNALPQNREAAIAKTKLEEAVMWATKAMTG